MEVRTYTERQNARRAAKAAGVDPALVFATDDGFTFPQPDAQDAPNSREAKPANGAIHSADDDDGVPAFLKREPPDASLTPDEPEKDAMMPKSKATAKTAKARSKKPPEGATGTGKTAVLIGLLSGKGATVEALMKATGWLPHTLRARISGLAKPKSEGGGGLKIERARVDGVTSYRSF